MSEPAKPDDDASERDYTRGHRAAMTSTLQHALAGLGYKGTSSDRAKWIIEREAAIAALRRVCDQHGDNDWDETLSLADAIEKHLHRHLGER